MSYNYKLRIAYDGSDFSGWQVQPGRRTVQGVLQQNLTRILREEIKADGASRTDAGVHALGQTASFKCAKLVEGRWLKQRLNRLLSEDVVVKSVRRVAKDFHARHSARGKLYRYVVRCGEASPFARDYCLSSSAKLDVGAMRRAISGFKGKHDFSSFCAAGGSAEDKVREIKRVYLTSAKGKINIYFHGNAFLYKMVRNMVGALLLAGRGKLKPAEIKVILAAKDRQTAPATAPAQGLYLVRVYY